MNLCNDMIDRVIKKEYYSLFCKLSPVQRFAERFRLETEALQWEIREEDEFFGWLCFEEKCGETPSFPDEKPTEEEQRLMSLPEEFGSRISVDSGHTLVDYAAILRDGLIGYERKILAELEKSPENEYLLGMKSTIDAVKNFLSRVAGEIEMQAQRKTASDKAQWQKICNLLRKVPYYPAENFTEALQSIWIIHFLLPMSGNAWYSISLGKFDEFMYPYYQKSVVEGMTKQQAKKLLHQFYLLLNSYADGACLLNIGGREYNNLSKLLIECQKEFALPAPILGARVTKDTPEAIWNALIDEKLFCLGQPTFYGEEACIRALTEKGISVDEAKKFSNNSCMGISLPSQEFNSMWGCVLMVSAALEAALNGGKLLCKVNIPGISIPQKTEEIFDNFEKCAAELFDICATAYEKRAEREERIFPNPFISILTEGCIEKHCDRISGAKYHNVTVECMGMVNVSDGIYAIDRLVFREKKYTLEQVNQAVKADFAGYEALQADLKKCGKFGENGEADHFAVRIADILQRIIRSHSHENYYYMPSLHTLDANVSYGKKWGASYDGRNAKAPFAKNAGASNEARKSNPTDMILSSTSLPQYQFFGGQPLDVNFQTDAVKNHKKELAALIKVYFERGGLQFQVNSLSSALLREATDHPEKYPNLVVRIGGYSIYFRQISKASKEEFIERFAKEGF